MGTLRDQAIEPHELRTTTTYPATPDALSLDAFHLTSGVLSLVEPVGAVTTGRVGALSSTRSVVVWTGVWLPAASRAAYSSMCVPSPVDRRRAAAHERAAVYARDDEG